MRPTAFSIASACALLFLTASCTHYHYSPNLVQTPYLQKQHDATVSIGLGVGFNTVNTDLQLAYSPVKHVALLANYFRQRSSYDDFDFGIGENTREGSFGHLFEGAVGAYQSYPSFTGALYLGWGQGNVRNDYGGFRYADLRYQRAFLQPTLTFQREWFRFGAGLRLVHLRFAEGDVDYRIDSEDLESITEIEKKSPFFFPETGFNIGFTLKPVTLQGNIVFSNLRNYENTGFDHSNISMSLLLDLHELFGKKMNGRDNRKRKKSGTDSSNQ